MTALQSVVFVVDDDAVLLFTLQNILQTAGYAVAAFGSSEALLGRLLPSDYGCVVIDLQLPGLNGLALQQVLHERGVLLPMIFISGRADVPAVVHAMKRGAVDFLTKPIEPEALIAVVAHALRMAADSAIERATRELVRIRWAAMLPRERDVCLLSSRGLLNKQIAVTLGIAESTVQVRRASAWKKLGVSSSAELVHFLSQLEDLD